jgi:RNA polymerase sigma-70 factor, ECF subfamily
MPENILTSSLSDEGVIAQVLQGDVELYEVIMRRYNQRLFRVARAILLDDMEAEDVVQQTYVNAFEHLDQFEARSKFSTWLTKIAINAALARSRQHRRLTELDADERPDHAPNSLKSAGPNPEQQAMETEIRALLESAVDRLPEAYRCVFVLRAIEGMTTPQTAECLELSQETVKIRMHRARATLRRDLVKRLGAASTNAFPFLGYRCDRIVHAVMFRIRERQIRFTS